MAKVLIGPHYLQDLRNRALRRWKIEETRGISHTWMVGVLSLLMLLSAPVAGGMSLFAQSGLPVTVSIGTQSLTVPWHTAPITNRFNPAVSVGSDRSLRSGRNWNFFCALNIGFFRSHWWMTGLSVEPEIGIGRSLPGGFYSDLRLGVGYMHYFWRRKRLELKDGRYVAATDWGSPSLILPLSVTLGYRGDLDDPFPVSPFVSARWGVQGLFRDEVSVVTHLFLLAGLRFERRQANPAGGL